MGLLHKFIPPHDRYAALMLYGMVFSTCFNGYDAGIMTVILADKQFKAYYDIDATRSGVIATIPWAATGLAQLFVGGTLASFVGRLWALRISISVMIIGVVIQVVPNTYAVLIVGRLVTGLGFGCIPIGVAFVIVSFWYIESPRWMMEKYPDSPELCLKALAKLRSGSSNDEHVRLEFHELVSSHAYRKRFKTGYIGLLSSAGMRKRLAYGVYAMALQQFGGIAALTMYAALIYESLGWNAGHQALAINGIQAALQLLIVLVNTFTVDKFGRRSLLIAGFSIQSIALLILSSLTTTYPDNANKAAAIAEVAMLFIVGLTYCWSNGPVPPAIASEIFPQEVRDKAFGLSALGQTVCLLALTQPWPRFNQEVGAKSYWLLFSLNVVALVSVIFVLPETKGISLERMDKLFGELDAVVEVRRRLRRTSLKRLLIVGDCQMARRRMRSRTSRNTQRSGK
ncbi:MFS glucose transporter [Lachnellula willkommii]|uniref:MFS glucose transporter n=1 Tax=Lachnellula willkommii TaxID=215461 RepID=A0A559MID9_9HELO|nr:MFS glucose transporter [Lachnellula willkommii]